MKQNVYQAISGCVFAAVCSTSTAFANDGGIPYIQVNQVSTKLKPGAHLKIKGGEAFKLYSVLPRDFVYDVSRSLVITSKKQSLSISCSQQPQSGGKEDNMPVGDPKTTECTFSIAAAFDPNVDDNGDSWVWEPKTCEQR